MNVTAIRNDFPILSRKVHEKDLVYFDNAASTQKPVQVIQAITGYYSNDHANIHRAFHYLGDHATFLYESAREKVTSFINAGSTKEVIFTRGTTESINLVATSLERSGCFNPGDEIILTMMEHHSNIVPWQIAAERCGAQIRVVNVLANGDLDIQHLTSLLSKHTKLVAMSHVSNSLGTVNPVDEIINIIRDYNKDILISIDGAQAIANLQVDVTKMDCDFYQFSGHKLYGPTGVGVLYGKEQLLAKMSPYQGGGEMIDVVKLPLGTTFAQLPQKFEAGTPNIAGVVGLAAAIDYIQSLDFDEIKQHKANLLGHCTNKLKEIDNITLYGQAKDKVPVISFVINGVNSQDLGILLDQYGIAVRTGHHCTMPLMDHFGIAGTTRASFGIYNTIDEVDYFIDSLKKATQLLL